MVKKAMAPRRPSEAGYNLVILMMTLTVLNILIAVALPKWSHIIRREREEELISRGFQYAEAVRIFQNRFQRLPVRPEELIEVEPRSIRKLWKDPMTDEGTWVLVPPGTGPALTPPPGAPDGRGGQPGPDGSNSGEPGDENQDGTGDDSGIGGKKGPVQVGPFIGVHSRSTKESILIFNGHDHYDQWQFTVEMLTQGGGGPNRMPPGGGQDNPANGGLQLSTKWLGRPLPRILQPQGGGLPQDGGLPNGRAPQPNPRGANRGGGVPRR
jgi:type II secretory pathway pseudopilin PulG